MLQVGRKVVLGALVAVSLSAFAGDTNAKVNKDKPGASTDCTDLNGKPLPCPDQGNASPPQQVTRPGENRCTDLDGHPLPCPPELPKEQSTKAKASANVSLYALPRNLLSDQKAFWISPARIREKDLQWLLPFTAFTAGVFASDTAIEGRLPTSQSVIDRSRHASDAGVAALVGVGGGLFLWGHASGNDQRREAGLLSGEAALGSLGISELLKVTTGRQRPLQGNGKGDFAQGGDSFPSEHAAAAWSIASVLAHEYPSPVAQLFAYGLAGGVSATRITGRKHFASDVLIGSALGWYMGRQVYRAHHGEDSSSDNIGTFYRDSGESVRQPENMGSPYVPLDAWIYPAFDQLAALGYVQTGFAGMRPWTRMECARLLGEASDSLATDDASPEVRKLYDALVQEFASEIALLQGGRNVSVQVESVYTRFTGISGPPLTDGYHFGQTITDDFGRPYAEGANIVTGASASAVAGPLAFYVRGEYQYASSIPAYSDTVRSAIAAMDENPAQPAAAIADVHRFRLLDTYVAINVEGFQITAGKQSLWWGPGRGGPLLLSDNAEPMPMLRISQGSPFLLPSFLKYLGPVRTEFFFAQMNGHHFPDDPYIHGQKITLKPTPNLEFGFSRTVVFAGTGHPLTIRSFWKSFVSVGGSVQPGSAQDVGDRRGAFDVSYRIPHLRDWLTVYTDSLVDDDPSPLSAPHRAAMLPGVYLSHVPGVSKLDLRVEAGYTDAPVNRSIGGKYIYWNGGYHDSHTNDGNLLGSWIGREGRGFQAWTTYWLSPRSTLQVSYRGATVSSDFVPGGGNLKDFAGAANLWLRRDLSVTSSLQFERWNFPLLATGAQMNTTVSVEVTFWPHWNNGAK